MPHNQNNEIVPLFVIGMNRSGTKWLSNELSRHSQIVCVKNETTGIRETNMLVAFGNKFDLRYLDEYTGLVELWAATDFFQRTGVDKSILYHRDPRPTGSLEMFEVVMDQFARDNHCTNWLQKTSPIVGLQLLQRRPKAHGVVIIRNMADQIRSNLARNHRRPSRRVLARAVFSYVRDFRILRLITRRFACPEIRYEDLAREVDSASSEVFKAWGLKDEVIDRDTQLKPNTSFKSNDRRDDYFSSMDRLFIKMVAAIARLVPTALLVRNANRRIASFRRTTPGTFANVYETYPEIKEREKNR